MPLSRVIDQPVQHFQGETLTVPASNGTRSAYNVRPGMQEILIEPVLAMRLQFVPAIRGLLFFDASRPVGSQWIDLLKSRPDFFDRTVVQQLRELGAMTSSDFIYVGVVRPIGGLVFDLTTTFNVVVSTLSAQYSQQNNGGWATLTVASDGTDSGGATLAQDGLVTFTLPAAGLWEKKRLRDMVDGAPDTEAPLHWIRLAVSATLSTGILWDNLTPISETAPGTDNVAAATGGVFLKAVTEYTVDIADDVGALETIAVAAGATTARVSWMQRLNRQ